MKQSPDTQSNAKAPEFSFGNFRLEADGAFFRGDTEIHLPPKELAVLRLLLARAGQVVTPAELKQTLWGDVHVSSDSVPRCLSSLRARLEPEQCIQTIYKRGYRLIGPVRRNGSETRCLIRLAIMPFAAGHNVPDHLGAAIAEEVTTRLTSSSPSWLCMLARDSVFTLARCGMTALQVGETLKGDFVLAGTLTAMPTRYRLRAEMIRVNDGTQVWVEDMLADNHEVSGLESELLKRLMFRLGEEIAIDADRSSFGSHSPAHLEAYDAFLLGHYKWQTYERHRMQEGMQHLIRASELDPSLLAAQVDLAHVCVAQELLGFLAPEETATHIRRISESVSDAVEKAPALLPALGWVSFHVQHDLPRAVEMYSASAHLPHNSWITRLRVMFALSRHHFDDALAWMHSASLVDPYSPWLHARLAWVYHLAGQPVRSLEELEKSLSLFPDHEGSLLYGTLILAFNGQAQRAVKFAQDLVRRMPYFDIATSAYAYALACNGERDEAYRLLEQLQWLSRERFMLRSFTPAVYAALGDVEAAVAELRASADARCPWFFQILADPRLETLYAHPEFKQMCAMLQQMELSLPENAEDPSQA